MFHDNLQQLIWTISYYLDGELLKRRPFPGNIHSSSHNGFYNAALGVGRRTTHRYFKGKIDDVRIFDCALNDSEIMDLCNIVSLMKYMNIQICKFFQIQQKV